MYNHICKSVLDTSFFKDGYMCPKNSIVSVSTCHDTIVNTASGKEASHEYEIETDQKTTKNMTVLKECDGSPNVCQCQQSEQFITKLPQSILKETNSTELADKSQVAFEQLQNTGKVSVETNTEPGIPFRNTPNAAIFSMKVQQTSTRNDEKEFSPINNLQKTLQRQKLPSVNIRPELCIQSGPTIHIPAKNVKQLRRNVNVTSIISDKENVNFSKRAINDEGNKYLFRHYTKDLEEAENVKSHVKVKSITQSNKDLLAKHEKFKHFVETFTTKLERENSKIHKNQNQKLLETLQSLSSNINELYTNFQYAVPSYQNCIMTRIDRVTQLLEYELQDEDSITVEHRCQLDEFFQQLTKSFQQEQYRRLWQKNVSVPPQDFITFKSSLESRNNLGRQEQIPQTCRPSQKKITIHSITNLKRNKQTRKQDFLRNERPNIMKNTPKTTDFSSACRRQVSKQVSFGKNVQTLMSDHRNQVVLRNSIKNDIIQSSQVDTKQSINETNNNLTKVNSNVHKPLTSEHISETAESWQAERMKVIQEIHEQLSEMELQFDSNNSIKSVTDSNISTEKSITSATVGRDSKMKTSEMGISQNQSQLEEADENAEVQYADDWEVVDDSTNESHDEDDSNKNTEVSKKGHSINDDGNNPNDDGDGEGENFDYSSDKSNSNNKYKRSTDKDYVQGVRDALLSNEDSCEDSMPSVVTGMLVSATKNQEDKEDDVIKIDSDDITGHVQHEIISDYSNELPIKCGIDGNKVHLHTKITDTVKDCTNTESTNMKESEILLISEICIQTDIQKGNGNRNTGTQIDANDCTDELFKSKTKEHGNLSSEHKNIKILCSSSNNQPNIDYECNNTLCENMNVEKIEKYTQTKTKYSYAPLQSATHDSAETVYEVSLPDCQTENAVMLKTRGKNQNIQFVVNMPNDTSNKQITCNRQFISENKTSYNNLPTVETDFQGPSSVADSSVPGTQKSELIKGVIESTVEEVLKKYNEPVVCTHLVKKEFLHTNRKTEYETIKSADESLHTKVETGRDNLFDLTVPNVSLETNTEFWTKLAEASHFLTNVASRCTEASLDHQIFHSDKRVDNKTGLRVIQFETKGTIGNGSSQMPECSYKTDENKKQCNNIETKSITNLTISKQDSTLSCRSSVISTSSSSSSCSVLKSQRYCRTNKTSSRIPIVTVSDGEICWTPSVCSCSNGELKTLYCHYCQSKKCDTSNSEDLSIGELKRKSSVNRNKKRYYGKKLTVNDGWNLESKEDTGNAHMSLTGGGINQNHVQESTDDTNTASEGEIKNAAEVVTLGKSKKAGTQMKLQVRALPRYLSSSQAVCLNALTQLEYDSNNVKKCNIKTQYTDHGKNSEIFNDDSAANSELLYKYKSGPKTSIHYSTKSTSKSFTEVAKRITEEIKKDRMSNLKKCNNMESDMNLESKESKTEVIDSRQLDKHHLLQNLELPFGIFITHDTIIPTGLKEDFNTARNLRESVPKSYTGESSMKGCLKFQYNEDYASNRIGEKFEFKKAEQDGENVSTREESKYSYNFEPTVENTEHYIKKQHSDLSVTRTANFEGDHKWKILSSVAKHSSSQHCNLNNTNNFTVCTSTEHNLGEWYKKSVEQNEISDIPTGDITNFTGPEDDAQQIPLQRDTIKSEHLVINFGNANSHIEVLTENENKSEPEIKGLLNDSVSSYDDLPGIYEIDFDLESKSSGELLPGIPAGLDSMFYTECESDSNYEVDKYDGHMEDTGIISAKKYLTKSTH